MTIYTSPQVAPRPDVFLAGGISGTENWQEQAAEALSAQGLEIANPRRPGMLTDPSLEPEQIRWEHDHLSLAKTVLFWFPGPGVAPSPCTNSATGWPRARTSSWGALRGTSVR